MSPGPALVLALALGGLSQACGAWLERPQRPPLRIVERGRFQYLFDREGRLLRVAYDSNGDRTADLVVHYRADRTPETSEADRDLDGVVDRWERYDARGRLRWVATASRQPGVPDTWQAVGTADPED